MDVRLFSVGDSLLYTDFSIISEKKYPLDVLLLLTKMDEIKVQHVMKHPFKYYQLPATSYN